MLKGEYANFDEVRTSYSGVKNTGKLLRAMRRTVNLNQVDVTEITGIPRCKISRYENEKLTPSLGTFLILFNLYKERGITDEWVVRFEQSKKGGRL